MKKKSTTPKKTTPEGMPSAEALKAWVADVMLVREGKKAREDVSNEHKKTVEEFCTWMRNLLPERDAIGAGVYDCVEWLLPSARGKHEITLGTPYAFPNNEGAQTHFYERAALPAEITLEDADSPPEFAEIPLLRRLPWVLAKVQATASLPLWVKDKETGKRKDVSIKTPASSMLFVSREALSKALWEDYGVSLLSLRVAMQAAMYEGARLYQVSQAKRNLGKKAFGHSHENLLMTNQGPFYSYATSTRRTTVKTEAETSEYYAARNVYYLVAFLDLVRSKDLNVTLPSSDCFIRFERGSEQGTVTLLDKGEVVTGSPTLPLEALNTYGAAADTLREILRYRSEIEELRKQRIGLVEQTFRWAAYGEERNRKLTEEELAHDKEIRKGEDELRDKDSELQDKLLQLYVDLTVWAAKHKPRLLEHLRKRTAVSTRVAESKEAVKDLVALPNNMGQMPAHFAAIPAGLEAGLQLEKDQYGRAILRVRRQGLHLAGSAPVKDQLPIAFPLHDIKGDIESSAALAQIRLLLGENGPRWLVPQGIVAVSKLYEQGGGYSGAETTVRVYENDWVDTMRPGQVARFREKGRGEAFGKIHKPRDLFNALIGVLNRLTYDSGTRSKLKAWSELNGFYLITGNGEDSRGRWTEIMLNPALHKFIIGDGGLPYMVTNTKAMFCYDKQSLDYSPAAQMGIESFARTNIYNRPTTTLSTPEGGGITRLALANMMGILRGEKENNARVLERFNRTLDNLGSAGVIADVRLDGRDKRGAEAFGVKLLITMHEDYRKAYDLSRDKQQLSDLDKALATPFVEPKPSRKKALKSAPAPAPKRRGRPPKAAAK